IMKSVQPALRVMMHLADGLSVIARLRQLARQGCGILERVLTRHGQTPVIPLVHPRQHGRSSRSTGGHGRVRTAEAGAARRELVQVRRLQYGMAFTSQTVGPLLVRGDEEQVRSFGHTYVPPCEYGC